MANGDGDQSKRPPLSQHDSDSQVSDHHSQHGAQYHRPKTNKHHVGARIHARVPSSKSLHKAHSSTSNAKLNRRQASPSPTAFAFPPTAPSSAGGHRRVVSDLNLSHEALKKNSSHTNLKRNRSKVEIIGKKSKSSTNLRSHGSTTALHNHKQVKAANQVHFNLGDDDDEDETEIQEDEWVDASTSASPHLSRRASVVSSGKQSVASSAGNSRPPTASSQTPEPPSPRPQSTHSSNGQSSPLARTPSTTQHNEYLTSRVLARTPAQKVAPPMMSTETATVRPPSTRGPTPSPPTTDSAAPSPRLRPGSSGNKAELTSRFITDASGGSTLPDSFTGALARAANGRIEVTHTDVVRRPKSMGNLASRGEADAGPPTARRTNGNGNGKVRDDDEPEKKGAAYVMNRTQQKINLQRASSSLEPSLPAHHPALALTGMSSPASVARGETMMGKVLERTGMEYLVVRRYQNPIARSLARLAMQERKLRVAKHRVQHAPGHSRTGSELRGPVQGLRDREGGGSRGGDVAGLIGRGERRPGSRRGDGEDGLGMRMSGSSLVDGGEETSMLGVLRNLWDKNVDLSASQE